MSKKPVVLGYWDIRGLGAPIRLLLEYVGEPWIDKLHVTGPAPTFDKTEWFQEAKPGLERQGVAFPNSPYLIDEENNVRLSQSKAILRYLGRKHGLVGTNEKELQRIDVAEFEEFDIRNSFAELGYNSAFHSLKEGYLAKLAIKLKLWSNFIGTSKWIAGDKLTYVDFSLFDILDQVMFLEPKLLDSFPILQEYQKRFASLERIKAYMSSDRYVKYPLNNRMAIFGG